MKTKNELKKEVLITVLQTEQHYVRLKRQLDELESKLGYDYQLRNLLKLQLNRLEELMRLNEDLVDHCLKKEP